MRSPNRAMGGAMNYDRTRWILAAAVLAVWPTVPPAVAQERTDPGVMLQAALHQELVVGDLEHAIDLYQDILARRADDRAVAARALAYLGRSYQKLGSDRAREAYERVVREYSDQPGQLALARAGLQALRRQEVAAGTAARERTATFRLVLDKGLSLDRSGDGFRSQFDFSPSGDHLVYRARKRIGPTRRATLEISDASGALTRPLVSDFGPWWGFHLPRWSPDGRHIAYIAYQHTNPPEPASAILVVSAEGGAWRQVGATFGDDQALQDISWTPDGREITYMVRGEGIYSIALDGGEPRLIQRMDVDYTMGLGGYSPDGRWLAFHTRTGATDKELDIWILRATGGRALRLTHAPGLDANPTWDRDGRTLYFISDRSADPNVWRLSIDPSTGLRQEEPQQVTSYSDAQLMHPKVLADGRRMAFGLFKQSHVIQVADATLPGEARPLVRGTWQMISPDGGTVFYIGEGPGEQGIFAVSSDGGAPVRLTPSRVHAYEYESGFAILGPDALAPDGRSLAYSVRDSAGSSLFTLPAIGGEPRELLRLDAREVMVPEWSPDGTRLAYAAEDGLYVIPVDGGSPHKLAALWEWQGWTVRWSPDGRHLAALGYAKPDTPIGVWVVPASGGELQRVTPLDEDGDKEGLEWHPDGRRLTYMRYLPEPTATGRDSEIRMAYLDGRPTHMLISQPDHWDYVGRWAPDGRRFFFITAPHVGEPWELHAYDEETGKIERVAADAGLPRWSRDGARMVWVVEQSVSQLWLMENF